MSTNWQTWRLPALVGLLILTVWEISVRALEVPVYILPGPLLILETLWTDAALLFRSLAVTLSITLAALAAAAIGGLLLVILMSRAPWIERSLLPWAVIAQVTPVVAIAPLIIIWVGNAFAAMVICAWIVAFFPVLANTMAGIKATDPHLRDLFRLYGASRSETQRLLEAPSALPYFLAGLRISGGLSLIGAVVAEFVAGSGGATGLAFRILEAGYRLQVPRLFAALALLSLAGVVIYLLLDWLSRYVQRRWYGDTG